MKVVIALLCDEFNRLLVTQRPFHAAEGGLWEFPGGKIELNEKPEAALRREIREELGLDIILYQFLKEIHYQHPDKLMRFFVFKVTEFIGKPLCLEGQLNMKWTNKSDLNPNQFPKANQSFFDLL